MKHDAHYRAYVLHRFSQDVMRTAMIVKNDWQRVQCLLTSMSK